MSITKIDKSNLLVITEDDSKLNTFARANEINTFDIPKMLVEDFLFYQM